jgi:hypothetical protein
MAPSELKSGLAHIEKSVAPPGGAKGADSQPKTILGANFSSQGCCFANLSVARLAAQRPSHLRE